MGASPWIASALLSSVPASVLVDSGSNSKKSKLWDRFETGSVKTVLRSLWDGLKVNGFATSLGSVLENRFDTSLEPIRNHLCFCHYRKLRKTGKEHVHIEEGTLGGRKKKKEKQNLKKNFLFFLLLSFD